MNNNVISGSLVYKGETGLSAYELAVQNGYTGSVTDWLATLGTSSHFDREAVVYETEEDNQTVFVLPEGYTSSSYIEVFVAGKKEQDEDITINTTDETITLTNAVATTGTEVEVVMITMSTNDLPISDTIGDYSTNLTASGTKSVYDYIEDKKATTISSSSTNTKLATPKAVYDYLQTFYDAIYPVGSIYMSIASTNPSTLFGGTWVQIKDTFLLACGDTYADSTTGGEASHTLSSNEMPSHYHRHNPSDSSAVGVTFKAGTGNHTYRIGSNTTGQYVFSAGSSSALEFATTVTSSTGGGAAHNNMPPYMTVYMWKRTA